MVILDNSAIQKGLSIRGKLGRPVGVGEHWLGWTYVGDDNPHNGYYQVRHRPRGQIIVKSKHHLPANPQSSGQTANRNVFTDGVIAWHALTISQKNVYNKLKHPKRMSGFNRFMREYLNANL